MMMARINTKGKTQTAIGVFHLKNSSILLPAKTKMPMPINN
jgi:hypothetical protein